MSAPIQTGLVHILARRIDEVVRRAEEIRPGWAGFWIGPMIETHHRWSGRAVELSNLMVDESQPESVQRQAAMEFLPLVLDICSLGLLVLNRMEYGSVEHITN